MKASRGFVLMAALLLLGLVSMAVLLSSLSSTEAATQQALRTQLALKEAKEAVLGYILLDGPTGETLKPGSIPCPDRDNDNDSGQYDYAFGNCIGSVYIYRFPGKDFRTGELRDSANEKLWYAISPEFRAGSTKALNSLTPTNLTIDGQGEYVAIVLAPGAPLAGQTRTDSATRENYLESSNASGTFQFVTTKALEEGETAEQAKTKFNDRLIGITKKEWEDAIVRRVASEVLKKLTTFKTKQGFFPPPAALTTTPTRALSSGQSISEGFLPVNQLWPAPEIPITQEKKNADWFAQNEWYKLIYYVLAPAFKEKNVLGNCDDPAQCLILRNSGVETTRIKALVIFAGRPLAGQNRNTTNSVAAFLEGEENTDGDNTFELPAPGSTSNDRFYIIK